MRWYHMYGKIYEDVALEAWETEKEREGREWLKILSVSSETISQTD